MIQIGEQVAKISGETKQQFPEVEWLLIKRFRNRVVHDYVNIDSLVVFSIIKNDLPQLILQLSNCIKQQINNGAFNLTKLKIFKGSIFYQHINFHCYNNFMINEIKDGYVKSHNEHGITTIEFFHPQSNSLPAKILDELCKEIHFAGTHDDAKVIIVKSGGDGAFCAGASFNELGSITTETQGLTFFSGFAGVINAMRKCNKLIIGRIHGKCVGGGVGIAAAVDYAIATEQAEIKLSELSIGFGPFVVGPAIERKIGASAFSQLAIDASLWRNADWAKRKGLFAEVHTSIENLDEAVYRLANNLAHYNPAALNEMKKIFWKGTDHWDELLKERAAISGSLVVSSFAKNAIENLRSKLRK